MPPIRRLAAAPRGAPATAGIVLGATVLLALLAILLSSAGTGHRPAIGVLVLLAAAVAGLLPLHRGLAVAIVLASFEGLYRRCIGGYALYWNEVFTVLVVLKSGVRRPPTRTEVWAAIGLAAFFEGYLVTGTRPLAVAWGAKVLLTPVVLLWAIARCREGADRRLWEATYLGLAVALGANVALAGWQRAEGLSGLRRLGFVNEDLLNPNTTTSGEFRAFGGFTSHAPFSYMAVIAIGLWMALVLVPRGSERRLALTTAWVPVAGALTLAWTFDRTALVGLTAAAVAITLRYVRIRRLAVAVAGVLLLALAATAVSARERSFVAEAASLRSDSSRARIMQSLEYLRASRVLGVGPASAGSGYEHVAPDDPLVRVRLWSWETGVTSDHHSRLLLAKRGGFAFTLGPSRPRLTITGTVRSVGQPRRLIVRAGTKPPILGGGPQRFTRTLFRERLEPSAFTPFRISIPRGRGPAYLLFDTVPKGPSFTAEFRSLALTGVQPRTAAERIAAKQLFIGPLPGVVDNLYVSWIFQYGIFGVLLGALWIAALLWPMLRRIDGASIELTARFVGVFLVIGALTVNIWEESPTGFFAAIIFAQAVALGLVQPRREAAGDVARPARPRRPRPHGEPLRDPEGMPLP